MMECKCGGDAHTTNPSELIVQATYYHEYGPNKIKQEILPRLSFLVPAHRPQSIFGRRFFLSFRAGEKRAPRKRC